MGAGGDLITVSYAISGHVMPKALDKALEQKLSQERKSLQTAQKAVRKKYSELNKRYGTGREYQWR